MSSNKTISESTEDGILLFFLRHSKCRRYTRRSPTFARLPTAAQQVAAAAATVAGWSSERIAPPGAVVAPTTVMVLTHC